MNKDKIAKLLNLSRSDNDHEALLAIRQANKQVGDWTVLIEVEENPMKDHMLIRKDARIKQLEGELSNLHSRLGTVLIEKDNLKWQLKFTKDDLEKVKTKKNSKKGYYAFSLLTLTLLLIAIFRN